MTEAEPIATRLRFHQDPKSLDRNQGEYMLIEIVQPDPDHPANLVSSLCTDGYHRPAIDIDVECELIPSSTPGHYHLYFPTVRLTQTQYLRLLDALADASIVERGYADASEARGQSLLRLPGVKKRIAEVAA